MSTGFTLNVDFKSALGCDISFPIGWVHLYLHYIYTTILYYVIWIFSRVHILIGGKSIALFHVGAATDVQWTCNLRVGGNWSTSWCDLFLRWMLITKSILPTLTRRKKYSNVKVTSPFKILLRNAYCKIFCQVTTGSILDYILLRECIFKGKCLICLKSGEQLKSIFTIFTYLLCLFKTSAIKVIYTFPSFVALSSVCCFAIFSNPHIRYEFKQARHVINSLLSFDSLSFNMSWLSRVWR